MFASLLLYHCITHDCLAMMIKLEMTGRKWNISQSATPVSADQRCANVSADQRHQLCNLLKWGQCSSPRATEVQSPWIFSNHHFFLQISITIHYRQYLCKKGYRLRVPLRYMTPEKNLPRGLKWCFAAKKIVQIRGVPFPSLPTKIYGFEWNIE